MEKDLTPEFMERIRENVKTSFYCRHNYSTKLHNIDTGEVKIFYQQSKGSPWIKKFSKAEEWLSKQEEKRLEAENIERPSTKWVFEGFYKVELKVVLDRQPLLGTGPLPNWLRNIARGRSGPIVALDTYQDNLCLWRCIAVHRRARPDRSTKEASHLVKSFYKLKAVQPDLPKVSLDELDEVDRNLNQGQVVSDWLGIRVYEPERGKEGEVVWYHRRSPPANLKNILTIGVYKGNAFVIKTLKSWQKFMNAEIAKRDSHDQTTFNAMPKHAAKEKL